VRRIALDVDGEHTRDTIAANTSQRLRLTTEPLSEHRRVRELTVEDLQSDACPIGCDRLEDDARATLTEPSDELMARDMPRIGFFKCTDQNTPLITPRA
jgi:hypothetical protein